GALGVAVVYGTLVWVAMSQLIVPLTQNQGTPLFTAAWFTIWAAHLTCVGPPITLLVRLRR
ncbi:MAG TPA: hypothetical protein VFS07_03765, partial [Gemmatimonadales bacterium]|nr:hypothetical protein [Gemmatimonadales bacterium]